MSDKAKQILLGSILGDGCISNENPARFSEKHSLRQRYYLLWKKNWLEKDFNFGKISYEKNRKIISIRTRGDTRLTAFRQLFYTIGGRKIITERVLEQFTPFVLAIWYCDDGTYRYMHHRCAIFSYNFGYKEHLLVQKHFKKRWAIDCKICLDSRGNHYLEFDAENTRKFLGLIKPAFIRYKIPKCMWYKLGHLFEGNQDKIGLAKRNKREDNDRW